MADSRRRLQAGLAALVAFSLFVCMVTGGASARAPARQIDFTPNVSQLETTQTAQALALGTPTVPTPGPGRYFDEGTESQIPAVARPELLADPIGYSAILGYPGLYLVWSTDDSGRRHYYVLEESSDYFQRIRITVDANLSARTALDDTNPWLRLGWAGVRIVGGAGGSLFCGVATAATIATVGLAAIFGTCTLAALGVTGTGIDGFIDVYNSVRAYENHTEEDRLAIEGIFREIAAAPTP